MKDAVIVTGARTPVGKAKKGSFAAVRPDDLAAITIRETLKRANDLSPERIDDVIVGCAMPEAEQGMNMARFASVLAGLPEQVPAITINRYCSSGLQSIAYAAERIMLGHAEAIIAGGAESMSLIPMGGHVIAPNLRLVENAPEYYMGMGHTAEEVAKRFNISRKDQDAFAAESHRRAAEARKAGKFSDEIVPVPVTLRAVDDKNTLSEKEVIIQEDEGIREQTTVEALAALKPAFQPKGEL